MSSYNGQIRIDGHLVYTALSEWTRLDMLKDGLALAGFEGFCPEARTPLAAIVDAMKKVFPDCMAVKLAKKNSWEIREVEHGDDENLFHLRRLVHLREDENGNPKILVGPFDQEIADKLVGQFNTMLGLVRYAQVTACMTGILYSLGGTSLRPRGAIYWIPASRNEEWTKVCGAVEAASVGSQSRCYKFNHQMDGDALKAVRDAIVLEVQAEVARIDADVQSGDCGERALRHRSEEAVELKKKIELYEQTLNTGLGDLKAAVERAEESALAASMLASVGVEA